MPRPRPAATPRLAALEDRLTPAAGDATPFAAATFAAPLSGAEVVPLPNGGAAAFAAADGGFALARFTADGSPDPAFAGGSLFVPLPGFAARGAAVDAAGGVLVAGGLGGAAAVVRVTAAGTLDPLFGAAGVATAAFTGGPLAAVTTNAAGFIVAAGSTAPLRATPGGFPDATFATVEAVGSAGAVAVDAQGRIVVAGSAGGDVVVARFTADGEPDATFGAGGRATIDFGADDAATNLRFDPAGRLVVSGTSGGATAVARLTADGRLDASFGAVTLPLDLAAGLAVDAGGVTLAGAAGAARLTADGRLDATFAGDGVAPLALGAVGGAALDGAGRLLVAATNGGALVVVRVETGATAAEPLAVLGVARLDPATAAPTTATAVRYLVRLSRPALGVDAADFALTTNNVAGAAVSDVVPLDATSYAVTVAAGTGDGSLRLDVRPDATLAALGPDGRALANVAVSPGFTAGEFFALDRSAPSAAFLPSRFPTDAVRFTTSEAVTGLTPASFALTRGGVPVPLDGATLTGDGFNFTLTGLGPRIALPGDYVLTLAGGADAAGLPLAPTAVSGTVPPQPEAFAVGAASGGAVKLVGADGFVTATFAPFGAGFSGEIRVTRGDFDGDGVPETVAAAGPGSAPRVAVVDGRTGRVLREFLAFEATFLGGVNVSAGDLDGDGVADLILSPDQGGGPRVTVLSAGDPVRVVADFFGIDDPNFRGGARTAVGDLDGDGASDLIVAAGFGGGPRVALFDGARREGRAYSARLTSDFFLFEEGLRNGAYVAAGDADGDGAADLFAGGGPGGAPRVRVLAGRDRAPLADFYAGPESDRGGVPLAARDVNGDGRADVVAAGAGAARAFDARSRRPLLGGTEIAGVFVG